MSQRERERFFTELAKRLEVGAKTYGDASFERHSLELFAEIQEELIDVCGWAFILWTRLERLSGKLHD